MPTGGLVARGKRGVKRVAVVGAGIAGLTAARTLASAFDVTLYESSDRAGGHAHSIPIHLDGAQCDVDIAFLSIYLDTYPRFLELLAELGVPIARSHLNFSVQDRSSQLEWAGPRLSALFAQGSNALRPAFWRMLLEIPRFNWVASRRRPTTGDSTMSCAESVEQFLNRHGFSPAFAQWYLLPIIGSVWGCPLSAARQMPFELIRSFFQSHGLLRITGTDPWYTIPGGSRRYVDAIVEKLRLGGVELRLGDPVHSVDRNVGRGGAAISVASACGLERYDAIVFACHPGQALQTLRPVSATEQSVLGSIAYHSNRICVHTDASVMPARRRAWAAWNYEAATSDAEASRGTCVHYWINRLQPTPFRTPLFVSLNPWRPIDPAKTLAMHTHEHPLLPRNHAQIRHALAQMQGDSATWFCGAWTGNGFHEDGLVSGETVAQSVIRHFDAPLRGLHPDPSQRVAPPISATGAPQLEGA